MFNRGSRSNYYFGAIKSYIWELYVKNIFVKNKINNDI